MGMVVRSNIMALNANRQLGMNNSSVAKNLEKLSSGFRINRAGDDASGLAISEKMKAQIKGLETASMNSQDGISLVQTAEGALTEVHDMLNRMVELAEKSANGTMEEGTGYGAAGTDRQALQDEMDQLSTEIDRIADSTNFNNIKLLNGKLKGDSVTTTAAVSTAASAKTDGTVPTEATKAKYTITLDGTNKTGGIEITGGTTTIAALGALTADGSKLSDLFTVKIDGADKDWTSTDAIASGAEIELIAKTPGKLTDGVHNALMSITDAASLSGANGTAEGGGSPATSSEYGLTFDFTKLADGQTFKIGDKTFEISTDGTPEAGNTVIDLKGLDLTVNGTSNTEGKWGAAAAIRTAINGALGADFTVDAAPTAAVTTGTFTIGFTAKTAGDAGNLGAVRVSESASAAGAIAGTYTAGKAEGKGQPGTFATVTYDLDLAKLAVGDKLGIGGKTIEIVEDADEDIATGKIGKTNSADAAKLTSAFESNGYTSGKIAIADGKLTITGTTVGQTGADLSANTGKLTFTSDTKTGTTTTGGLRLQIGDTNDSYNKMTVMIDDMHMKALFSGDAIKDDNGDATPRELNDGTTTLDISSQETAGKALTAVKKVINTVSSTRAGLGAIQNRLEHTINNLDVAAENMNSANSRIRDTDMAKQMMEYTKMNVLTQAAQAMLAQANQQPQSVLQLLQ